MIYKKFISELYQTFEQIDIYKLFREFHNQPELVAEKILKEISGEKAKKMFREEIDYIIENELKDFENVLSILRKREEIIYYERSIAALSCVLVFWMWDKKIKLPDESLSRIIESILLGTLGYRIIDMYDDSGMMGSEVIYVGNYLIHLHEKIVIEVFGAEDSLEVVNKYFKLYAEVEFAEKKNRWIGCPFSWEDPLKLGYKAAPFFSIMESLGKLNGMTETQLKNLQTGMTAFAAVLQMLDDISDAKDDLSNGIESLVMSGFYKAHPRGTVITEVLVEEFLNQEGLLKFYETTDNLFSISRNCFKENKDDLLLLCTELYNLNFNKNIEVT